MPVIFGASQKLHEAPSLGKSISPSSVSGIWFAVLVGTCAIAWCVFDSWNHELTGHLFNMQEVVQPKLNEKTGTITGITQAFQYPLLLAFIQFGFMGLIFFALFLCFSANPMEEIEKSNEGFFGIGRWRSLGLVLTHVFGTFWLQALMMPTQMMSLGLFAASRALEIPTAAAMRSRVMNARFGGHSATTSALMFSSAWLLFYAYSQIAQCLCIWSGYGVALTGPALWIIYALVLTIPVANTVYQEACMVQLNIHPVLMLAVMNLSACVLFIPVLFIAHFAGWEHVGEGAEMIMRYREATMLVVWLCVQMCLTSGVTAGLVCMVDSFWTTALRSMRVVFWWLRQMTFFSLTSTTLLSVSSPHSSLWSFIMVVGLFLSVGAIVADNTSELASLKSEDGKAGRSYDTA